MLRLTVVKKGTERRLLVEGELTGPAVTELESLWRNLRDSRESGRTTVDLSQTTAIDSEGKRVLVAMAFQGAELFARGIYTSYVVRGLLQRVNSGCRS